MKCSLPVPADKQNRLGGAVCRNCHGMLRFHPVLMQWVHL